MAVDNINKLAADDSNQFQSYLIRLLLALHIDDPVSRVNLLVGVTM